MPHALLLSGLSGVGKRHFAQLFAQFLLCETPTADGTPCGQCRGCTLFGAGSHPDCLLVQPAEEGKSITVEQVRGISAFQGLRGQYGMRKVVVLWPAESMNVNAANALLKTLEEPTEGTVLLLCTDRPLSLLPTIRSRCQQLAFRPVSAAVAAPWLAEHITGDHDPSWLLELTGGAPLAARALVEQGRLEAHRTVDEELGAVAERTASPLKVAERWAKEPEEPLRLLYLGLSALARNKAGGPATEAFGHLQAAAQGVDLTGLLKLLDKVQTGLRLIRGQINAQLLLEDILFAWAQLTVNARTKGQTNR